MKISLVLASLVLAAGVSLSAICVVGFAAGNFSMDSGLTKLYVMAATDLVLVGYYWLLSIWERWPMTDSR